MIAAIDAAKKDGDTLGGSILVAARGVPAGLGSYGLWDRKLDGRIGQALLSVLAREGRGARRRHRGRARTRLRGARRDRSRARAALLRRRTNRAGGLEAGVTNGEDVVAVAHMKPISTLARGLDSVDLETGESARGRPTRAQRRHGRPGLRRDLSRPCWPSSWPTRCSS